MRVLVTGASGFIGAAVARRLAKEGRCELVLPVRAAKDGVPGECIIGNIAHDTDWSAVIGGIDIVIHCAARAHILNEQEADPLSAFRSTNVDGTLALAKAAAAAGVRRFVFISSIKVNGENTKPELPFTADDAPAPADAYGQSKLEAEWGLQAIAAKTGMEVVVIRPPLVYGPGVKANFQSMMRWLDRGVPLPLGAIRNSRSLVALDNLVSLIETCMTHPAAANQTFLVSDGEDLSTGELLRRLAEALDRPVRLLPVPAWLLEAAAFGLGKRNVAQRLCGSLQVDIGKTRQLLGWSPPVGIEEALADTVRHFRGRPR